MKPHLFFIAIIPDSQTCNEVDSFKKTALNRFESGRALRSPAHITLEPPFKWSFDNIKTLEETIREFAAIQTGFQLHLNGFGHFDSRVLFIDVLHNDFLLALQENLSHCLREKLNFQSDRPPRPYHPHMTIAFKDLRKAVFPKAWEYFSNQGYQKSFEVRALHLLEHDGKVWQKRKSFAFRK